MLLVEIKDFNALIDDKPFFDYLYHQNYYKLIGIDLGKSKEDDGATMFFHC